MGLKYVVSSLSQLFTKCFVLLVKQQQITIGEADSLFTRRFIEHCLLREYLRVPRGDLSIYSVVIIFLSFTISSAKPSKGSKLGVSI